MNKEHIHYSTNVRIHKGFGEYFKVERENKSIAGKYVPKENENELTVAYLFAMLKAMKFTIMQ